MNFDMVVSDFDDTLLRDDATISRNTLDTIEEFTRRGGKFFICTGRMFKSIMLAGKKFGIKGLVSGFQGALIGNLETGEIIKEMPIPKDKAIERLRFLESKGYYIHIYDEKGNLFTNDYNDLSVIYEKWCGVAVQPQKEKLSELVERTGFKVFKIIVADTEDRIASLYDEIESQNNGDFVYSISKPILLEIVYKGACKGSAVKYLADKFQIPLSKVMACGDSLNDMPMLKVAGLSIAVENGSDTVKNQVDFITKSNNEDGVAFAIKKFCFGEE